MWNFNYKERRIVSFYNYCPKKNLKIVFTSGSAPQNNGGTKLYNLWVKLLRENGYDAYIATVNGNYNKWLVNHQPVISFKKISQFLDAGFEVRVVIGWLGFPFDQLDSRISQFYYFDAELNWTRKYKSTLDRLLRQRKIAGIATHSRYIQSWYISNYGLQPSLINEWSDRTVFFSDPRSRINGLVGCIVENDNEDEVLNYFNLLNRAEESRLKLIKIAGSEKEVAQKMRTLDVYIGLNSGKDPLWGEGCPRTQQEALHSGAVLVAFDVKGNREYLTNGFSGILVNNGDADSMWRGIKGLMDDKKKKETLRKNGLLVAENVFSDKGKMEQIEKFLGLKGTSIDELKTIFPRNFWLQSDEAPFLAKYAFNAKNSIVEIGCAYGGSSTIFLLNKQNKTKLCSIDPFIADSMGGFRARKYSCYLAVWQALKRKHKLDALRDWGLVSDYSYEVVKRWNKKIDLLFIDGSHLYKDVKKDFEDWEKFVAKDGLILFHDSRKELIDPKDRVFLKGWNGPTRVVKEILSSGKYKLLDSCYSISVLKRK